MTNLTQRVITAVVAIPLIVFLCVTGGPAFFLFIAAASAIALREFYRIAEAKGAKPLVGLGIAAGFFVNLSFFHYPLHMALASWFEPVGIPFPSQSQLLIVTLILTVATMSIVELFRNKGSAVLNLSTTFAGIMYVSLFFGTFIGIRELFRVTDPQVAHYFFHRLGSADAGSVYRLGGLTAISVLALIWICDSAAFHAGLKMGKHKLFLRVSPNKSWEGALAGFFTALLAAAAAQQLILDYLPMGGALLIGFIVGTFGQVGDLVESLFKRDAAIKDSSTLIPGHGGAFDRFDSLLLVSPVVYLYLDFVLFS